MFNLNKEENKDLTKPHWRNDNNQRKMGFLQKFIINSELLL
jgi:hypothetical protein